MDTAAGRPASAPSPLDLVEGLINTRDLETAEDRLRSPSALRAWLSDRHLIRRSDAVSGHDLERVIALREALRRAVRSNNAAEPDNRALRDLNALARDQPVVINFRDGARLSAALPGVTGAIAQILAAVYQSMLTGTWSRLKGCANDGCQWAFYDASKNRSARWCDMADCGNDAKGRAYRARRRLRAGD